jgi:nucleoside-diphosphate-sugar epimerase
MAETVLVTGSTGFTGSHLCRRLLNEGYCVRGLARRAERGSELRGLGVEVVVGDLRDPGSLGRATTGVDVVYHIAALFREADVSREELWRTNVEGTENILESSLRAGVRRFVHCSTVGVHGDIQTPPANEETEYDPGDDYQESKAEGERLALRFQAQGRLPVVVFRPAGIYGPGDTRFLKLFRAIRNRVFVMIGSGEVLYQMVYIDDVVDGILRCGTMEQAAGNVYILTGDRPVTLNRLVGMIADAVGVEPPRLHFPVGPIYAAGHLCELACSPLGIRPPLYRRRVDFFRKNRAFSIEKARAELGFRPQVGLQEGLRITADWYVDQGLL